MGSQFAEATQRNHTIVLRESQYENHSFSTQPCKPCARRESIPSNCSGRCGDQASREGSRSGHNTSGAAYSIKEVALSGTVPSLEYKEEDGCWKPAPKKSGPTNRGQRKRCRLDLPAPCKKYKFRFVLQSDNC